MTCNGCGAPLRLTGALMCECEYCKRPHVNQHYERPEPGPGWVCSTATYAAAPSWMMSTRVVNR